jgi:hypothetical protein
MRLTFPSGITGYPHQAAGMVGEGWRDLILKLIADLDALGWDGHLNQVKEKFGGLRFYIGGGTSEIFDRISEAEEQSYSICEMCGKPGQLQYSNHGDGYWMKTLCQTCGIIAEYGLKAEKEEEGRL